MGDANNEVRVRQPRRVYDPAPVSSAHVALAIRHGLAERPSDVTPEIARLAASDQAARREAQQKEDAERREVEALLEAATPRPLPFILPPRERSELPTATPTATPTASCATPSVVAEYSLRKQAQKPIDESALRPLVTGQMVDLCSEFTGIGGFEHGLCAGFSEAHGVALRLIEASELDDTAIGQHATAVLHKRFPDCQVLGPDSRTALPYPPSADMLTVTPICTQHSGLNADGDPDVTEATLRRVFARIGTAPSLAVIAFENVPNFLSVLDGQIRSSYAHWLEALTERGFTEHACAPAAPAPHTCRVATTPLRPRAPACARP
jgi:hypothetical protein